MSGNIPQSTQFLNKTDKGSVTTESQIFSIIKYHCGHDFIYI